MKDGMNRYASKERIKQKGYFRKHCDGGSGRKAREASRCNSLQQSRKKQEEVKEYSCREGHQFNGNEATHSVCGGYACPHCPVNKHMGKLTKEEDTLLRDMILSSASKVDESVKDSQPTEIEKSIEWYGKVVQLNEEVVPNEPFTADEALALSVYEKSLKDIKNEERREEESAKALEGRQEGIQGADQRRSEAEEKDHVQTNKEGKIMKKQTAKHKKHEAKESKAYEKKEDKKEKKAKKP